MDYTQQIIIFLVALVSNWFSALAGGGAGLSQLPALIFLGLPFPLALATHKVATVALGLGATGRHLREGHLNWGIVALIIVAGGPAEILGVVTILDVPARIAEIILGMLTLALVIYSLFKPELGQANEAKHRDLSGLVIGAAVLFVFGFINGALSAGSGLFVTLWLIYWFGLDYKTAVAQTMLGVGLVWNATGAFSMGMLAEVQWSWIPALLVGSLLGGYFGAHTSILSGNKVIKRVFELITLIAAIKLLWG